MKRTTAQKKPLSQTQLRVAAAGGALVLAGLVAFWIALAPLAPILDVLKSPTSADPATMADFDANLKRAAIPSAIGGVLLLAGIVMLQFGLTKKERTIEEIVDERVEQRLAAMQPPAPREPTPPATRSIVPSAAADPELDALLASCPACGGTQSADGRCAKCGRAIARV